MIIDDNSQIYNSEPQIAQGSSYSSDPPLEATNSIEDRKATKHTNSTSLDLPAPAHEHII